MTKHTFLPSVVLEIKRSLESPRRVIGLIWNQSEGQDKINNFRACENKTRLLQKFNFMGKIIGIYASHWISEKKSKLKLFRNYVRIYFEIDLLGRRWYCCFVDQHLQTQWTAVPQPVFSSLKWYILTCPRISHSNRLRL